MQDSLYFQSILTISTSQQITETNGGQCDEGVIDTVNVGPALDDGEEQRWQENEGDGSNGQDD